MKHLLYGIGINDANYVVKVCEYVFIDGVRKRVETWCCPYYTRWKNMLTRCYSTSYQNNQPTYKGCTVCDDWLKLSSFKTWMEQQDWEGKQLDKDILFHGNKVYSPETCMFVSPLVNSFFLREERVNRGEFPVGVSFDRNRNKYTAKCNQLDGSVRNLGRYDCPETAHLAWKIEKQRLGYILSESESNLIVKNKLLNLFN
jgi:hypothetical protein